MSFYLIRCPVKFPLEMFLFMEWISLYHQILLRGFTICECQMAVAVILKDVFLKKHYLMIVAATKLIAAQNCIAKGFCHSGIMSSLKGTICGVEQKLFFLKV